MSKKTFQAIAEGLEDAIASRKGTKTRGRVRKVQASDVDVAATRGTQGLSQEQFAAAFGVSLGTVRNWEQGHRTPDCPALALLTVIEKSPRAVLRAIWPGSSKGKAAALGRYIRHKADTAGALRQSAPPRADMRTRNFSR